MLEEHKCFLSIINNYVNEEKTEAFYSIDWQKVFDYSQSHQLTAIIYHQCKSFIPQSVFETFKACSFSTIYSNTNRRKTTENVIDLLQKNGIDCFLIKGFDIADFYPNWQYRTMGDTDIVVDDLEKSHNLLLDAGFKNLSKIKGREYQYSKQNMEFELHDRLVYEEAINLDSITEFLNDYSNYVVDRKLDDSFHFVFVLNHLRKHFMNSGVGFRQFVDIAVLIKNDEKIDWAWTEERLRSIGLLSFAKTVFYYIERWFDVPAPIGSTEVSDDVFDGSTAYIFDNGVFGFENEKNKGFLASNTVRQSKHAKFTMVKMAVTIIFPSYKFLCESEHYSFLKEKPYLLPLAWIYRFIRGLKNGRLAEGKEQLTSSFVSREYIAQREAVFKNWGL